MVKELICKRCGAPLVVMREGEVDWSGLRDDGFDLNNGMGLVFRCRVCHSDDRVIVPKRKDGNYEKLC